MSYPVISLNKERNVTLTCCFHDDTSVRRPAMLVLPGGGYQYCSDREAENVAACYVRAGFHGFVLRYSLGKNAVWPNPLEDYEQAIRLIREKAEEWGVLPDKIAVIGFSAGGHLASAAATLSRNRPNAAILCYAVTQDVQMCLPSAPDTVAAVDSKTCPCFLAATRTDDLVPIRNSIAFSAALAEAGVSFESHIYSFGPHGFSLCTAEEYDLGRDVSARVPHWADDSIGWLRELFGHENMPPVCGSHANGDHAPTLSIDCTIGHLLKNEKAAALLQPMMAGAGKKMPLEVMAPVPLATALRFASLTEEQKSKLNNMLSAIPNE